MADCLIDNEWRIDFNRQFGKVEADSWILLKNAMKEVSLNSDPDKVIWGLEKSGRFSVKSLYRHISFGGRIVSSTQKLWKSKLPLKVKIFI